MITGFLGKYKIILIMVALLGTSGWYIKTLIGQKAVLKADLETKELQLNNLKNNLEKQRRQYEATLSTLEARESRLQDIERQKTSLNLKIRELQNDKESKDYLDTDIPSSILNLLHKDKSGVSGETNPSIPSTDSTQ